MDRWGRIGAGVAAWALVGGSAVVTPAPVDGQPLANRSRIEVVLGVGVRTGSSVSTTTGGVTGETSAEGLLASLGYSRWLSESLAVIVSAGVLTAEVDYRVGTGGVTAGAATVVPLFAGVRYYFPESANGAKWRPYASIAVGPVIGSESRTEVGSVIASESITRAAFGGRIGAGVDVQLSHRFMLGVLAGYDLMTDFSDPIGARDNHSGPDFGVSFSVLLGEAR